jgi:MFS family permease
VAFLAGSVLGGMAPTLPVLVAARVVQGLGGGGLLVLIQAVIADRSRWRLAGRGFAALAGLLRLVGARAGGHR